MQHQPLLSHVVQTVYAGPELLAQPNVPTISDQLPKQMQTVLFYRGWTGSNTMQVT